MIAVRWIRLLAIATAAVILASCRSITAPLTVSSAAVTILPDDLPAASDHDSIAGLTSASLTGALLTDDLLNPAAAGEPRRDRSPLAVDAEAARRRGAGGTRGPLLSPAPASRATDRGWRSLRTPGMPDRPGGGVCVRSVWSIRLPGSSDLPALRAGCARDRSLSGL